MNKKIVLGIVLVLLVVIGAAGAYLLSLQAEAAKWKEAKEIAEEEISSDGVTRTARFVSVIEAPVQKVEQAVWNVENSAEYVDNIKQAKLVKQEGNTKLVQMQIQALSLPIQHYTMQFTRHPAENRISFKTVESQTQDIEGSYELEGSPDGTKTRLVYESKARDKVAVPFPESVIEGATRETFVNTVRGIKKSIEG